MRSPSRRGLEVAVVRDNILQARLELADLVVLRLDPLGVVLRDRVGDVLLVLEFLDMLVALFKTLLQVLALVATLVYPIGELLEFPRRFSSRLFRSGHLRYY